MKKSGQLNEEFIPLWFQLPPGFYRVLKAASTDAGLTMAEALKEAVRLFPKLSSAAKEAGITRTQLVAEAGKLMRNRDRPKRARLEKPLVAYRWEKVPPEQRSNIGRELARQRWGKRDENSERPA